MESIAPLTLAIRLRTIPLEVAENRFLLSQAIGMDLGKGCLAGPSS